MFSHLVLIEKNKTLRSIKQTFRIIHIGVLESIHQMLQVLILLKYLLEIDTYMFIDDISELETNKSDFNADLKLRLWSSFHEDEILKGNDTINLSARLSYRI